MVLFWDLLASRTMKKTLEHCEQLLSYREWGGGGRRIKYWQNTPLYCSFISSTFLPILTNCLMWTHLGFDFFCKSYINSETWVNVFLPISIKERTEKLQLIYICIIQGTVKRWKSYQLLEQRKYNWYLCIKLLTKKRKRQDELSQREQL